MISTDLDVLLESLRQKLGVTPEQEQTLLDEIKANSTPTQDMSNLGEMLAFTVADSQAVAEMVSSVMMDLIDIRAEVTSVREENAALKAEVEALKQ